VVRTRVGYAGGATADPTYRSLGDHAETIQIDYDPAQISYAELLDVFWSSHAPTSRPWSSQYASIVFYHNEEQRHLAVETREREATKYGEQIFTAIEPFSAFYLAEDYHQKYRLRGVPELLTELQVIYPNGDGLVNSTAAARLNGYIGGNGTMAGLKAEIDDLGLSATGRDRLLEIVSAFGR
jgi:methionine-S-sulfoxide reductase